MQGATQVWQACNQIITVIEFHRSADGGELPDIIMASSANNIRRYYPASVFASRVISSLCIIALGRWITPTSFLFETSSIR